MARPLKLDDAKLRKTLLTKIRSGYRLRDACEVAGIDYSSFRRWLRDGEPPENGDVDPLDSPRPRTRGAAGDKARREYDVLMLKREFYHAVESATATYRAALDAKLRRSAGENFRDLMTYARIRFPDDYRETAPKAVVQVNNAGHDGGPLTFAKIAADAVADMEDEGSGDQ